MGAAGASTATEGDLAFARPDEGTLVVRLAGAWRMHRGLPSVDAVASELTSHPARRVAFDTGALSSWDSGLLTFLGHVIDLCKQRHITADRDGLPAGVRRLLALAEAVPEKKDARREDAHAPWLARVGIAATRAAEEGAAVLAFLGEVTLSFGRFITRRARYRTVDLLELIQQAGAQALPIVTLISFLVGTILAFVGAVQLQQFGAQIYVANLVGIGMVREMGAMMTGIVMAGRTGAAFAAQLGSMKVTQEIEALSTMGISPLDFLVLPRMIALCLMMPLLCLYSDFIGMLGGAAIGVGMLRLPLRVYYDQTVYAITLTDFFGGIFKASVYGVLIAIAGCLRGMQSGTSSSAVGDATTSAVVTGIVFIITACGIFAVVFWVLGI
jgi:phospholipid/cholesterol/gamma-HCH transport system permease protein